MYSIGSLYIQISNTMANIGHSRASCFTDFACLEWISRLKIRIAYRSCGCGGKGSRRGDSGGYSGDRSWIGDDGDRIGLTHPVGRSLG